MQNLKCPLRFIDYIKLNFWVTEKFRMFHSSLNQNCISRSGALCLQIEVYRMQPFLYHSSYGVYPNKQKLTSCSPDLLGLWKVALVFDFHLFFCSSSANFHENLMICANQKMKIFKYQIKSLELSPKIQYFSPLFSKKSYQAAKPGRICEYALGMEDNPTIFLCGKAFSLTSGIFLYKRY